MQALSAAVASGNLDDVLAIFGPDGKELIDSSDPVTARRNREVFAVALAEGWRIVDDGSRRTLVIGNEGWPFPVPIVQEAGGWRFDTTAGKEEVLARRIGRNELAAIQSSGPTSLHNGCTRSVDTTGNRRACTRGPCAVIRAGRTACIGQRHQVGRAVRSVT